METIKIPKKRFNIFLIFFFQVHRNVLLVGCGFFLLASTVNVNVNVPPNEILISLSLKHETHSY
jgi:hypothetical protein